MEAVTATPAAAPTPPQPSPDAPEAAETAPETVPEAKTEPAKAPEPPPKRTRKIKINGSEQDVDEESLILAGMRAEQKERAASERWAEAQKARAEVEKFQKTWEQDPVAALSSLGPVARQAAEQFLLRELQREQMDPRERAVLEERAKREEIEARFKAQEEEKKAAELRVQQDHYVSQLDQEFAEVMKTASLPKTTESVRLLAQEAMQLVDMGIPPTRENLLGAVQAVQAKLSTISSSVMAGMDGPSLLKWLGPDIRKRIREAEIAAVKGQKPAAPVAPHPPKEPDLIPGRVMLTREEWHRRYGAD